MTVNPSPGIESLKFDGATFSYEGAPKPVFKDVSIDLPLGKNIWVTGQAGHGQSTFLKLMAAIVQPQSGRYLINDCDTTEMSFEEFLPFRKKIGYTFDLGGLFANRTLLDNLTLPLLYHKISSRDEAEAEARAIAERFRFAGHLGHRPASVSGGLRKLVCVLRAFILRPELMVMDDPFTGVDAESVRTLLKLIEERRTSGELRHIFFTSRDELWPERMGYEALIIDSSGLHVNGARGGEKVA